MNHLAPSPNGSPSQPEVAGSACARCLRGTSGAGKSSLIKTYLWRQVQANGAQLVITDPKGEYAGLAAATGLRAVHIGGRAGGINPMGGAGPEAIDTAVALAEHRLGRSLAGEEEDALARVVETRPASLAALVLACEDPPAQAVARIPKDVLTARLQPVYFALRSYLGGRWAGLFDRQSPNPSLGESDAGIVVDLGITSLDAGAVPAMVVVASWLRQLLAHKSPRRRIVVLDEGWALVGHPLVLRALLGLAKLGRSAGVQLILAVHRPSDLLAAVGADATSRDTVAGLISEANTKILYRQDPGRRPRHRGGGARRADPNRAGGFLGNRHLPGGTPSGKKGGGVVSSATGRPRLRRGKGPSRCPEPLGRLGRRRSRPQGPG
ncbi:MAG: helicase HerA domain-containing protein [Acidimicrobiales bacterium]